MYTIHRIKGGRIYLILLTELLRLTNASPAPVVQIYVPIVFLFAGRVSDDFSDTNCVIIIYY